MKSRCGHLCLVTVLLVFGIASGAQAAPITYQFQSGTAHIKALRSGDLSVVVDEVVDMGGAFVTFDPAQPDIIDFELSTVTTDPISMLQLYGGYDTFVIESAVLTPNENYQSIFDYMITPTKYLFLVGPVDVAGVYSASNSQGPTPPPVSNLPVPFTDPTLIAGKVDIDAMTFEVDGITLLHLNGALFGETDDLIVVADISWNGAVMAPEPSTSMLLGLGLTMLTVARRGRRG